MHHVYKINGVEWVRLSGILSTHHRGCEGGDLCLYSPHSFIGTTYMTIDHFCTNAWLREVKERKGYSKSLC